MQNPSSLCWLQFSSSALPHSEKKCLYNENKHNHQLWCLNCHHTELHGQVHDLCFTILLALHSSKWGLSISFSGQGLWGSFFWIKKKLQSNLPALHGYECQQKHAQSLSNGGASPKYLTNTSSWLTREQRLCAGCWQGVGSSGLGSATACSHTALLKKTQKVQRTWSSVIMNIHQLHAATYCSFKWIDAGQIPRKCTKTHLQQL